MASRFPSVAELPDGRPPVRRLVSRAARGRVREARSPVRVIPDGARRCRAPPIGWRSRQPRDRRLLGRGRPTVWRYLRAAPCATCGCPVVTAAERCRACAVDDRRGSPWASDQVVEAISLWVQDTGTTPSFRDWRASPNALHPSKWELEWPRWPHASAATTHFETWTAALHAAGFTRRYRGPWSDDEILDALRTWTHEHGRPPSVSAWGRGTLEHPVAGTVKRRFGRWSAAVAAANLHSDS
jgi:hypothetical protein